MPDYEHGATDYKDEDDKKLEALGYVPSFKREFSNLATVCAPHLTLLSPSFLWARPLRSVLPSASWYVRRLTVLKYSLGTKGLCSSVATTFNTPLLLGGPSSVRKHAALISVYDSIRIFSKGNVVLDPRSDHVFHFRRVLFPGFFTPLS